MKDPVRFELRESVSEPGQIELSVDFGDDFNPDDPTPFQAAAMIMVNGLMDHVENWEKMYDH